MAAYRIVCTRKSPVSAPTHHAHIVTIGLGDDTGYNQLLSMEQAYHWIDTGNTFYTKSKSTGAIAQVNKYICGTCGHYKTLRSSPDAISDNNLDNLPNCN